MASSSLPAHPDPDALAERQSSGFFSRDNQYLVVGVILLALYPVLDTLLGRTRVGALEGILVYVILAMGLNIVVGYAGLLDLGYAAFFAIGAYTMGFLTSPSSYFVKKDWVPELFTSKHYGFWAALAVSWVVAAIFGVLLGAPTLRLRGDYLAIVTLGFGEIVPNFFRNASGVTGGIAGMNPIGKPYIPDVLGHQLKFGATNQRNWYYLMLVIGLLSLLMIRRFYNSRLGRTWAAVREDEIAAASMGVNLVRTKLWAFALGASFAGFAGSIYSSAFQYVAPDQFEFSVSVTILAMVILGGLGNIYGVVVGALLIGTFDRILAEELSRPLNWLGDKIGFTAMAQHNVTGDRFLVFGLALVLMMLLKPGGLISSARRRAEMTPEDEQTRVHEQQQMYDIHDQDEPAAGSRA
jgi:branched-chain amino acid transport system permease protein